MKRVCFRCPNMPVLISSDGPFLTGLSYPTDPLRCGIIFFRVPSHMTCQIHLPAKNQYTQHTCVTVEYCRYFISVHFTVMVSAIIQTEHITTKYKNKTKKVQWQLFFLLECSASNFDEYQLQKSPYLIFNEVCQGKILKMTDSELYSHEGCGGRGLGSKYSFPT